jgi:hypothetical protein
MRSLARIPGHRLLSQVLKRADLGGIADQLEIQRATGAEVRAYHFQGLPRKDADGDAQSRPNFGKSRRYARFYLETENETIKKLLRKSLSVRSARRICHARADPASSRG